MGIKHRHYDVIVAWANGETIEGKNPKTNEWEIALYPSFYESYEFRIKPKTVKKEGWVNVYKWSHCEGLTGHAYGSKECADKHVMGNRKACIRIEWEEEQ
jgi:hypothetical protein